MRCSVLQHSFASSRNREICEGSKPTCSHSSRTYVWAGLHHPPQSLLGTATAHSIPLADKLTFLCGEQTCTRSSAPLLPHFSANSFGRCVWAQQCIKVVEGQVRGVVCGAAVQVDIPVQDLFLSSVSETADGGITQLMERNIGEESSQVLLWPGHSTVRGRGDSWWGHHEVDRAQHNNS